VRDIRSEIYYGKNLTSLLAIQVITSRQLRAARALAGLDQAALAKAARLSLPTIQRMEASEGVIRGNVESLMKLIAALDRAGIELINEGAVSDTGGRGVRLKLPPPARGRR
jgi:transcriptional regulator with XRE-family HTH domain